VPHHLEAGTDPDDGPARAVVATAEEPTAELADHVRTVLGVPELRFVATTDWDVDQAVLLGCQDELVEEAVYGLAATRPDLSASTGWSRWQWIATMLAIVALVAASVVRPSGTLTTALIAVNVLFFVGVAFKLVTCVVGIVHLARVERSHDPRRRAAPVAPVPRTPEHELPVYTILVPAYHEANVVTKVIEHVRDAASAVAHGSGRHGDDRGGEGSAPP
jgi:membrane glycosyltransferase